MIFTSQIFLFVFFPICMFTYYAITALEHAQHIGKFLIRIRCKDLVIIVFGLGFYMWACFDDVARLLAYVVVVYVLALWIESVKKKNLSIILDSNTSQDNCKQAIRINLSILPFIVAVAVTIFCLIYYNYTGILTQIWNWAFRDVLIVKYLAAPLGFSFITFSAISYLTDIYRDNACVGSFVDCALYLTFFPKIISGPIVLWKDFQPQIKIRNTSTSHIVNGLNRIMIGFAKK